MRLAVLDDGDEDTPLTMRVPNLHEDEIQGDQVGAYLAILGSAHHGTQWTIVPLVPGQYKLQNSDFKTYANSNRQPQSLQEYVFGRPTPKVWFLREMRGMCSFLFVICYLVT